jgi:hypothetical protein
MHKNSQVSIEYMMIIGFVTIIIVPLLVIYHSFTQESSDEINSAQIDQLAKEVVDAAESVFYLGEPSQTTLKVNVPSGIVLASLSGNEMVFKIKTKAGNADIVRSSAVNISGSFPAKEGTYAVTVKAQSDYVQISYS